MGSVKPFVSLDTIKKVVKDVKYRDVFVPEWGGTVRLKQLTNSQLAAYTDEMEDKDKKRMANVILVLWTAINEDGTALFPVEMASELADAVAGPFNLLAREALDLNGVTKLQETDAKNASGGAAPAA